MASSISGYRSIPTRRASSPVTRAAKRKALTKAPPAKTTQVTAKRVANAVGKSRTVSPVHAVQLTPTQRAMGAFGNSLTDFAANLPLATKALPSERQDAIDAAIAVIKAAFADIRGALEAGAQSAVEPAAASPAPASPVASADGAEDQTSIEGDWPESAGPQSPADPVEASPAEPVMQGEDIAASRWSENAPPNWVEAGEGAADAEPGPAILNLEPEPSETPLASWGAVSLSYGRAAELADRFGPGLDSGAFAT